MTMPSSWTWQMVSQRTMSFSITNLLETTSLRREPKRGTPLLRLRGQQQLFNQHQPLPIRPPAGGVIVFTSCKATVREVFVQIKHDSSLRWFERLKTPPKKKDMNKYCEFHQDLRYTTETCYELKCLNPWTYIRNLEKYFQAFEKHSLWRILQRNESKFWKTTSI